MGSITYRICKSKGTPKSKILTWLAIQKRIWTADRQVRHSLQENTSQCYVCLQEEETVEHILMQCVCAQEVWYTCKTQLRLIFEPPTTVITLAKWWSEERAKVSGQKEQIMVRYAGIHWVLCHLEESQCLVF